MCNLCVYRQCSEHINATSRVVNYCTGNSNMYSSSFGVPVPQAEPHTSTLRHGEKTTQISLSPALQHVTVFPDRSVLVVDNH